MVSKNYLLDTHCLLWFQGNNPKLSDTAKSIIQSAGNTIFISQVSLFEIAIKQSIGKLPDFKSNILDIYDQSLKDDFAFLQLHNNHLEYYNQLPLFDEHRDPFDRLLIATSIVENAAILTIDSKFRLYSNLIEIIW